MPNLIDTLSRYDRIVNEYGNDADKWTADYLKRMEKLYESEPNVLRFFWQFRDMHANLMMNYKELERVWVQRNRLERELIRLKFEQASDEPEKEML